jgi:hypothetical protein
MERAARWNGSSRRSLFSVHKSLIRVYNTPTCLYKTEIYKNGGGRKSGPSKNYDGTNKTVGDVNNMNLPSHVTSPLSV